MISIHPIKEIYFLNPDNLKEGGEKAVKCNSVVNGGCHTDSQKAGKSDRNPRLQIDASLLRSPSVSDFLVTSAKNPDQPHLSGPI